MNRYLIEGLLRDLVYRLKDIIVATWTEDQATQIRDAILADLQRHPWRAHRIERVGPDFIRLRSGNTIRFKALSGRRLEGMRADVWVLVGLSRIRDQREADHVRVAVKSAAHMKPGHEIIEID